MKWHFYIMVFMYCLAGIFHFVKPKMYLKIMPSYMPNPKALVFWSGVAELVLSLGLLLNQTRLASIYGVVLMLIVFLPVHVYMIKQDPQKIGVPRWFSVVRLPIQFVLIWWALYYL